ncbi:MAG: sulfite oxidase-like oxidoreductase [Bradymonadia bacterium]
MNDERVRRREAARLKLRARYLRERHQQAKNQANPGERLPVGQVETTKWPVLDLGIHPEVALDDWRLRVDGAVERPITLTWSDFMAMDQVEDVSDFHCVTTWSKFDLKFCGVPFWQFVALVSPLPRAQFVLCHAYDGYTTNLSLAAAMEKDVMLVHAYDDKPLTRDHGGPCRMITPKLYAWKGAKWINRIEFLETESLGYWEKRGYSNTADPWTDDRYSEDHQES